MTPRAYAGRPLHQVVRDRVRALALQFEAEKHPTWFAASGSLPQSLGRLLAVEFRRARAPGASLNMIDIVQPLARWALSRDASTPVAAKFAVRAGLDLLAQKSLGGNDAPAVFRGGTPWTGPYRDLSTTRTVEHSTKCPMRLYSKGDIEELRRLPSKVSETLTKTKATVVQAAWSPRSETPGHLYDPVRPPLEALAIAALHSQGGTPASTDWFEEISPSMIDKQVLGIGLGLCAGPQALSVMIPDATVYSDAAPYHGAPVEVRRWDFMVLNVPTASAFEVAAHLGSGGDGNELSTREFGELVARSRRKLDVRTDHLPGLVDRLVGQLHDGARVVVLADLQVQEPVEVALAKIGLRQVELLVGTKKLRAVYVGAGVLREGSRAPRRHRGLPPTTGRIVSAWERS